MVAAFRIYKSTSSLAPERQLSHLGFHIGMTECLVKYEVETRRVRLREPTGPVPNYLR